MQVYNCLNEYTHPVEFLQSFLLKFLLFGHEYGHVAWKCSFTCYVPVMVVAYL